MPKNLAYSLRFPSELRTSQLYNARHWKTNILFFIDEYEESDRHEYYYDEGFLAIQNAIAKAFIEQNQLNESIPEIRVQPFPSPSHTKTSRKQQLRVILPLVFLIGLCYTFVNTVRYISIEKEKQLRMAMKVMGLPTWMHYMSWFIRSFIMLSITMLLITIIFKVFFFFSNFGTIFATKNEKKK